MNFEGNAINRFEHREMIDHVHAEIKRKFDADRIDPNDFDLNSVERDLAYLADLEKKFGEETDPVLIESKKLADILEYFIYFHGEQSSWLGDEAETIAPSRFDDVINGVDVLVDLGEEDSLPQVAGLGIDATTSPNPDLLFGKITRIREEIQSGKMAEVKYFEDDNFKGSLKNIPKIVISADQTTVIRLVKLFEQGAGSSQAFAEEKFQYQLLEQILRQCEVFAKIADFNNQPETAKKYRFFWDRFAPVFAEKMKDAQERGIFEVDGDTAHVSLMNELSVLGREIDKLIEAV